MCTFANQVLRVMLLAPRVCLLKKVDSYIIYFSLQISYQLLFWLAQTLGDVFMNHPVLTVNEKYISEKWIN